MCFRKSETPLAPPTNKEIVEALSVLKRAVQYRADEIGVEQHNSYENMVMELLDAKKANFHTYIF